MEDSPAAYAHKNLLSPYLSKLVLQRFSSAINWDAVEHLLDVGCGPANTTVNLIIPKLKKDYKRVVGMDFSPNMINYARDTYCSTNPRLEFKVGNIEAQDSKLLAEHFEQYDLVTSMCCLHWIKDQK